MSADASVAEAAASSDVLDLNAEAAAVDGQERARAAGAEDAKSAAEEALAGPTMGSHGSAEEGLNGEGTDPPEDEGREAVVEGGDVDATGRSAEVVVTGGREAMEGKISTGGYVEGQDDRRGRPAEADASLSTGPEIIEGKTEVTVEHVDGLEDAENLSSKAENRIADGSTEPDGGKSLPEVGMGVAADSQPAVEKDDGGDVAAPDPNSAVALVQSVESGGVCSEPVVEEPKDQGDVAVAETNLVTGIATGEVQVENSLMAGETIERKVDVIEDAPLAAEAVSLPVSQASENESCDHPTKVGVSTDLVVDRGQEMGEKCEDTGEKPLSGGDAGSADAAFVDKLPAPDQNGNPEVTSINGDCGTSQVTECVVLSGSGLVAEECLPESSKLGQNLPTVLQEDPSQVDMSAGQLLGERQRTEVQHVGSPLDENQNSQPTVMAGQDVSLTTRADLAAEDESIKPDTVPSEEMHDQEVNLNKKEDDGVTISSDVMEDELAGAAIDGDKKEDMFEKCITTNPGAAGTENTHHSSYHLPQEDNMTFSISNLVWGKVKSHPWWPGQIFDPFDASDMALKHQKRDNFLVAYFGDKTFAWCEESKLKPFRACFYQLESQSTSDVFINAVNSALFEVSRRLELGMSCTCVPEEVIDNLRHQKIENAGIREGSSRSVVDKSFGVSIFEPNNFVDYIKALALYPCGGMDKLELMIAKAQLMAFNRLRYHSELPASIGRDGLVENDAVASPLQRKRPRKPVGEQPSPTSIDEEMVVSDLSTGKQKKKSLGIALHRQKNIPEHGRKQKSLSELMDDKNHSDLVNGDGTIADMKASVKSLAHSSGKKRKNDDFTSPYSGKSKRKRLDALGDLEKKTPTSDRSFKVGECISRIASKLTGSPSIIKCNGESLKKSSTGKAEQGSPEVFDISLHTPEDTRRRRRVTLKNYSSPEELLSQLCLAAKDPMKGYSFLSSIISFFKEVRELRDCGSMVDKRFEKIKKKRGRKKKSESNVDSKNELSGTHTPSSSVIDEKPSEKIRKKRGRKKKSEEPKSDSKTDITEASTPDYMTDSYWTDRIVCTPEEKSQSSRRKRKGELLTQSATKKTKPLQETLPLSKMLEGAHHLRISTVSPTANRDPTVEKQATFFGEICLEESTPTALILSFNEPDALPSETNLIRIFSRYGPLKEAETEVLRETNCAKVVFKRRADAEVAFSSAGKYCIFGPALVSYRLRYLSSTASPEVRSDDRKGAKTLDDVSLVNPAQEGANALAQEEVKGLAREETKESAQDEADEFTQSGVKELAQDETKELCHEEVKELAQEEATELTQKNVKELDQAEANELAQDEVKELAQDVTKESCQEDAKEFVQDDVKELAQEEVKDLAQDEVKELAQGEPKDLAQDVTKESCQEDAKECVQDDVKELAQEEVKDLAQDEMKGLCEDEVKESVQEDTKESTQEEMKELAQAEANE